jgi:hypothetical protein
MASLHLRQGSLQGPAPARSSSSNTDPASHASSTLELESIPDISQGDIDDNQTTPYEALASTEPHSEGQLEEEEKLSDRGQDWLPASLRWQFLLTLTMISVGLCVVVSALCLLSGRRRQHGLGLGADDGSDAILVGWRFSPTLICVVYAQLISMLFDDIRRTEPFAKMSRFGGAPAANSVLERPKSWWSVFVDAFRNRKGHGRATIPLQLASFAFIISILIIQPLSSSFLISYNVTLDRSASFRGVALESALLPSTATPEMFLGTTGHLFYNLSGTPWISGQYVVLPFWLSDMPGSSFQNTLSLASASRWTALTKVLKVDYPCGLMEIESRLEDRTFVAESQVSMTETTGGMIDLSNQGRRSTLNGTVKMLATKLRSSNGCEFQVDRSPFLSQNQYDSLIWSRFSDPSSQVHLEPSKALHTMNQTSPWNDPSSETYVSGNTTYSMILSSGPTSPFFRSQSSEPCSDQQFILWATPLLSYDVLFSNYSQKAWACSSNVSMAEVPVTLSISSSSSNISFDEAEFLQKRTTIPATLLNTSKIDRLFYTKQWSSYLLKDSFVAHEAAIPLGRAYNDDFRLLSNDQDLPVKARAIFARFFGEALQFSLSQASQQDIQGRVVSFEKRVVVVQGVGISLAVLFAINAVLLVLISKHCRPIIRPINLRSDPSSALTIASIFAASHIDTRLWQDLFLEKRNGMKSRLHGKFYKLSLSNFWEVDKLDACEWISLENCRVTNMGSAWK